MPENTLQAFKYALKDQLSSMLEMDVRITKDNQIVVAHDEDLLRLCGDSRKMRDVNFKDLPKFKKKLPCHFTKFKHKGTDLSARYDTRFETYDRKPDD